MTMNHTLGINLFEFIFSAPPPGDFIALGKKAYELVQTLHYTYANMLIEHVCILSIPHFCYATEQCKGPDYN